MKRFLPCFVILFFPVISFAQTAQDTFVARVIFAEALVCSNAEREMVVSVMKNRINHPGFGAGKLGTLYAVASQKGAFSCVGDSGNKNWAKSANPDKMTKKEKAVYQHCLQLAQGNFTLVPKIVYYHDRSIKKPKNWDNKYWETHKEVDSRYFIFYSVTSAK